MNKQRIKEIRERCEKASPGPWKKAINPRGLFDATPRIFAESEHKDPDYPEWDWFPVLELDPDEPEQRDFNMEFLTEARQDLPDALDYIEELDKELLELREKVESMKNAGKGAAIGAAKIANYSCEQMAEKDKRIAMLREALISSHANCNDGCEEVHAENCARSKRAMALTSSTADVEEWFSMGNQILVLVLNEMLGVLKFAKKQPEYRLSMDGSLLNDWYWRINRIVESRTTKSKGD